MTEVELVIVDVCLGSGLQFRTGARAPILPREAGVSSQASALEVTLDIVDTTGLLGLLLLLTGEGWGFLEVGTGGFLDGAAARLVVGFFVGFAALVVFGFPGLGLTLSMSTICESSGSVDAAASAARSSRGEEAQIT